MASPTSESTHSVSVASASPLSRATATATVADSSEAENRRSTSPLRRVDAPAARSGEAPQVCSSAFGAGFDKNSSPRSAAVVGGDRPVARECIRFRCPTCNEVVVSIDEALSHCADTLRRKDGEGTTSVSNVDRPPSPTGLPQGETIALDEKGRPSIVRTVDAETGKAHTVVRNEDGSQRVFDESAVDELTSSSEDDQKKIIAELTNHQLRGLVHEVGQRLLERSQLYHSRLGELEKLGENLNLRYFGLDADATERDLDNAYRKLAKKMHPDKNGGTEQAKRRFQDMKERYENCKKRFNGEDGNKDEGDEEDKQDSGKDGEDEDGKDKEKSTSIEYDPSDKDCMVKTVSRMANQLSNINIQMDVLVKELKRAKMQSGVV
eukprot:TRINITY_DN6016_c0_g1_i4.p1 TRINITY_DN6016_c0_g1~~TRINITY_DN6016_c0_g1_i4.p1  ORF type:complete len:421 (-),score=86.45 TRINITY_DN6016_c0_g1_i4:51-1187(-)